MKVKNNGYRAINIRGVRIEPGRVAEVVCTKKDLDFFYKVEVVPEKPAPAPAKPAVPVVSKPEDKKIGGEKK